MGTEIICQRQTFKNIKRRKQNRADDVKGEVKCVRDTFLKGWWRSMQVKRHFIWNNDVKIRIDYKICTILLHDKKNVIYLMLIIIMYYAQQQMFVCDVILACILVYLLVLVDR